MLVSRVEWMIRRMRIFAIDCRVIVDGVRDAVDLGKAVIEANTAAPQNSKRSISHTLVGRERAWAVISP
jgi:hypothetical protein